ncbi:MAG TPA: hypothetical protein VH092_33950 [Urbifossiella sp.]|nr:hypothetical protein [Urbifossiella sp.]
MTTAKRTTTKTSKPAYIAYTVRNNEDQKEGFWTRLGVAFPHQDGKGFNLLLDAYPLDGRITLRVPSDKPAKAE